MKDEFWSVELFVGMGPLELGAEYSHVLQVLRDHRIDVDRLIADRAGNLSVSEIQTHLHFSQTSPRTLARIDVDDERLRFGSLSVIGKRVHEIVGIFKLSRKKTLWCSDETSGELWDPVSKHDTAAHSRDLLARGTLWIPHLGLGLTLREGLVVTVHLCDPVHAPRVGTGSWTKEQQMLSEVRELPAVSASPITRKSGSRLLPMVHLAFVASMGVLIGWSLHMQRRWDAAPDVPAVVVALDPPPPAIFAEDITLSFDDSSGVERRTTLGHMQFLNSPKLGDEFNIRYLPEAPESPLGPVGFRDVGFDTAVPYGVGIFAIYAVLNVFASGSLGFRVRPRSS